MYPLPALLAIPSSNPDLHGHREIEARILGMEISQSGKAGTEGTRVVKMVARKISKKDVESGIKFSRSQTTALVDNMLLSEPDKMERAMLAPRNIPEHLKPNGKGERRGGRQKGTPNKLPAYMQERVLAAFERFGYDGRGLGGVDGWLDRMMARFPEKMLDLAKVIIPRQIIKKQYNRTEEFKTLTVHDVVAEMRARGLPVEHLKLFEMDKGRALEDKRMKEINPEDRPRRRERAVIERE
jgi:hypothetical protein